MILLGRVILSNYFDTTFDEYCFTDDVTGAGIVTEVKNTLCQLLHGEWMRDSVKETSDTKFWHGLFRSFCLLFIHPWKHDPQNGIKIIGEIYSTTPYHIHRYLIYPLIIKQWTIEKCCVLIDSLCRIDAVDSSVILNEW